MSDEDPQDDPEGGETLSAALDPDQVGVRLDRALAAQGAFTAAALSRERIKRLLAEGAVTRDGVVVSDPSAAALPGLYVIHLPAALEAEARAQDLGLVVLYEDGHLIVVDKPAGMAAHPGPGTADGTLVNALLHHCGGGLSGIGGVARPGIVHRLDKDTSGVMVAAKTDAAHQGLGDLFARHAIERLYVALTRGAPDPSAGTIATRIGRSPNDRKKMAVLRAGGREAITHYRVEAAFGSVPHGKAPATPLAARVSCKLETGRTHQIRVHLASKGAPCLGDVVYGSGATGTVLREAIAAAGLARQALHAAVLGFVHPITGEALRFETPLPPDMARLETDLASRNISSLAGPGA